MSLCQQYQGQIFKKVVLFKIVQFLINNAMIKACHNKYSSYRILLYERISVKTKKLNEALGIIEAFRKEIIISLGVL